MTGPEQLFFLPGALGRGGFWRPVADQLTTRATRVFFGWPGFGDVPVDPSIRGLDDLAALVAAKLERPSALIAQSMGGVVALLAALRRPEFVTHLVLTATSGGLEVADLRVADWRPEFIAANPALPRWFSDYHGDLAPELGRLTLPTLLLWGDADPISPLSVAEHLRAHLHGAKLEVIPGGEHDVAQTHAAVITSIIDRFLETT